MGQGESRVHDVVMPTMTCSKLATDQAMNRRAAYLPTRLRQECASQFSGIYKELECSDTKGRARADLSPSEVIFGEDNANRANFLSLSTTQSGSGIY